MAEDTEKNASFQVKDHRRFNPDGTMRQETEAMPTEKKSQNFEKEEKNQSRNTIEINFSTFLLSLASSAQISLGLIPHPATNKPEINIVSACQTIDIIGMLEAKTKGNLSKEEEAILKQILFELRMQYVEIVNQLGKKPKGTTS